MKKTQQVTLSTSTSNSKIYLDDQLEGTGSVSVKVAKEGAHQVVLRTPGYKDNYTLLLPSCRQPAFYPCIILDGFLIPTIYGAYAFGFEMNGNRTWSYAKSVNFDVKGKTPLKTAADKFLHISNISLDLSQKNNLKFYTVPYRSLKQTKTFEQLIAEAESKKESDDENDNASKSKSSKEKLKDAEDKKKYDDTKFSENIYATLKKSGFIDTVNKVFQDENNTLLLEGKISSIKVFRFDTRVGSDFYKARVNITWYLKNKYGEKLDSVNEKQLSGEFMVLSYVRAGSEEETKQQKQIEKMIGDAIDNSYLHLYSTPVFKNLLKSRPVEAFDGQLLHLTKPSAIVSGKSDATLASVIIKRDDNGHGSGFAISQDGYLLTNYHVVASDNPKKPEKLKVVLSGGEELEATLVRFNKAQDIALLKVEHTFEKAFLLGTEKSYKPLTDVYTVGAPKSIELGQTMTAGLISNERNSNNNELLQLSMPINFGNSGGPLFDASGTLDGVIVAKLVGESTEGICFAIPAYRIHDYIKVSY